MSISGQGEKLSKKKNNSGRNSMTQKVIKIMWYKGTIGRDIKQKLTIKGLGFKKLHQIIEVQDTPAIRGMIRKIPHLVKIISE